MSEKMIRRIAREVALQSLFQIDFNSCEAEAAVAAAMSEHEEENAPKSVKVLEINPESDLFKARSKLDDDKVKEYGSVLYDEARLISGFEIDDKEDFLKKLNTLRVLALSK